jgi:hypothetical protein
MKPIIANFILNPKQNQYGTGDANGKTRDFEIALKHKLYLFCS